MLEGIVDTVYCILVARTIKAMYAPIVASRFAEFRAGKPNALAMLALHRRAAAGGC